MVFKIETSRVLSDQVFSQRNFTKSEKTSSAMKFTTEQSLEQVPVVKLGHSH